MRYHWQAEAAINSLSPYQREEVRAALQRLGAGEFRAMPEGHRVTDNGGAEDWYVRKGDTMAMPGELMHKESEEQPWIRFRATPEEIARLVADTPLFDFDAWMTGAAPGEWTAEDEADFKEWLAERRDGLP